LPRVIIVGCGFLGETVADFFFQAGWDVLGLCASEESAARLGTKPYPIRIQDITQPSPICREWQGVDALVHAVSSRGGDASAYRAIYLEGLLNGIATFQPRGCLFVSSTSVYAQTNGSWVDETSETQPDRETGKVLLEAEQVALLSGGYVARLGGLYGPGRSVLRKRFLAGEAVIEGDGSRWINQIHRDDAARALRHLFVHRAPPGVYNVVDDTPATQRTLLTWLAEATGRSLPPEGPIASNRRRGWSNKRVRNVRLRESDWRPTYPSYATALADPTAL